MSARTGALGALGKQGSLFLLSLLLLSCSGTGEDAGLSPGPAVWTVAAEPQAVVGETDGEPEYLFSQIAAAALLPGGGIAVADRHAASVRLYSPDGSFLRELGRRGEGPGEFANIRRVVVHPPDTILVHDSRLYRLTTFLTSGELVSTLSLQAGDGFPEVYLGGFSTGERAFAWIKQALVDFTRVSPDVMQLGKFGTDGRLTSLLGTETGMVRLTSPIPFSPQLHAEMIGDSIFLTNGLLPEIKVWDPQGELARTILLPFPVFDPAEAWAELEAAVQAHGTDFARQQLETQPREGDIPHISMMMVDDRDRLWVKRYDPGTDSHLFADRCTGGEWTIIETSGAVVATMAIPDGLLLLDVRGGQVLGRTTDELGVQRVVVYDIVELD